MTATSPLTENDYSFFFEREFERLNEMKNGGTLYEASHYILNLKGKRIRPVLVMMGAAMFDGDLHEAIYPAMAVEFFHNSTLVHDDIMDASDIRRGKPAVHKVFGMNTAINSGNVLTSYAYKYLLRTRDAHFRSLVKVFNKATIEVMEGQAMDLDFETNDVVAETEYLRMIELKTAVLLGASLQMGAVVGNAGPEDQANIYNFGKYLGIAFQVKDDYLDAFGDHSKVGKIKGGDILNNKKTLLYIKAQENANPAQQKSLEALRTEKDASKKILTTLDIYHQTGAKKIVEDTIRNYSERSRHYLMECSAEDERKQPLLNLATDLMNRDF